jgi:hypothetical protein
LGVFIVNKSMHEKGMCGDGEGGGEGVVGMGREGERGEGEGNAVDHY